MATPPESEGKIMASAEDLCGLCEDHMAIKHCAICFVELCATCTKAHLKLSATKNHQLTNIIRGGAATTSSKPTTQTGACAKHGDKPFAILCKDCVELGCDSCKADHGGHSTQPLDNDPKLCHRVVSKNIQHLLDDIHELEEIKAVFEGQICAYDDAIVKVDQWECDLLKIVREKAERIRRQLKELKDCKYKQLSDQVNGLMVKLKEIDQSIVQLTALRKSMDFTVLTKELATSQNLINKLQSYKDDMQPLPSPVSVDDVLPNGDKIKDVDNDLDVMFSVKDIHSLGEGPVPVAEWCFTAANNGRDISVHGKNHVSMTNVTYGPGPKGNARCAVVVRNSEDWSMVVVDPDDKLRFNTEMTICAHVFLGGTGGGPIFIYDKGTTTSMDSGFFVWIRSSKTELQICSKNYFNTPDIFSPNTWQKVVIVMKPSLVTVYIGAKLVHTEHKHLDLSTTHKRHLYFGRAPEQSGFEGRIASCKFYDVALDENEIEKL